MNKMMDKNAKIYIAGHNGMVGSALLRLLQEQGYENIVVRTSSSLDLRNQEAVRQFFSEEKPVYVIMAAAKVGGIQANNTYRAEFLYDNLMMQANVIHQSHLHQVKKLLFLASSCIYPKMASQPIKEEYLLTGSLEDTNEPYAIAKIAGVKICENYNRQYGSNFISVMPTNLYGPNDNYDLENSHVLPALLRKIHEAKINKKPQVEVWGTGTPKREFLHADDLAAACIHLMNTYDGSVAVNIGTGSDVSIKELALLIKDIVGYSGDLIFNTEKPDGTPRKLLDVSLIESLGWKHTINLRDGIENTYKEAFLNENKA
jgi:GDP-L-fucose synthase|tara:strand:+ start:25250 stop:26197 length:948 start_codon:yes stop_codon:yes gene_type:complete